MRSRTELVEALIEYREPIAPLMQELRTYGWDSDEDLATLSPEHVISVLNRFQSSSISASEVQEWANAIERREDIALNPRHNDTLDEMVFWLANPAINFPITTELASRVISNLEANHVV